MKSIEEAKSNIIKSEIAIEALKHSISVYQDNLKEYEILIEKAKKYIEDLTITYDDIIPGAVFDLYKEDKYCESYVIIYTANREYYFGGVCNNPCNCFSMSGVDKTRKGIIKYWESNIPLHYKVRKTNKKVIIVENKL